MYAASKYVEGDISAGDDLVGGNVWKSTDNGATWTDLGSPNRPATSLEMSSTGKLFAGYGAEEDTANNKRGLYKYNGTAWFNMSGSTGHKLKGKLIQDLEYISTSTGGSILLAVTGETGQGGLYASYDEGSTFKKIGKGLPTQFWGTAVIDDPSSARGVYVAHSRPAAKGKVYKCVPATTASGTGKCYLYYTGLKDETFNSLLFDGLVTGSNLGVYDYKSFLTNFKLKKKKLAEQTEAGMNQYKPTAHLTDKVSRNALNGRIVKLYKKKKKNGTYRYAGKTKVKRGKAVFIVKQSARNNWYQVQYKPNNSNDKETYGKRKNKSNTIKVPKSS